jgi:hypothetical protein
MPLPSVYHVGNSYVSGHCHINGSAWQTLHINIPMALLSTYSEHGLYEGESAFSFCYHVAGYVLKHLLGEKSQNC